MTHQAYMNKKGHLLNVLRDAENRGDFYLEHDCVDELNLLEEAYAASQASEGDLQP